MSDDRALLQALGFIEQRLMHINESLVSLQGEALTIRDRFALAALTGMLASGDIDLTALCNAKGRESLWCRAYAVADTGLAAGEVK
ncbi:MAG: hypothetical protein ACOZHQ_09260 [Thermodesulfobacteriota bacterium]